ncbi:MAG: TonB-dependent receptor, partial [Bacteroidetes bacterium]
LLGQYLYPDGSLTKIEIIPVYGERNSLRMSPSHRLDVNLVLKNKPTKKWHTEWHFGAYNFYNRATPYRLDITFDEETGRYKYTQPGLFGFIPSIAWNFRW